MHTPGTRHLNLGDGSTISSHRLRSNRVQVEFQMFVSTVPLCGRSSSVALWPEAALLRLQHRRKPWLRDALPRDLLQVRLKGLTRLPPSMIGFVWRREAPVRPEREGMRVPIARRGSGCTGRTCKPGASASQQQRPAWDAP
jgi:hypothetical protein